MLGAVRSMLPCSRLYTARTVVQRCIAANTGELNEVPEPIIPMTKDGSPVDALPLELFKPYIRNADDELKCKRIILEMYDLKTKGRRMPKTVPPAKIPELLAIGSMAKRLKFYTYLFKTECRQANEKTKKELRQAELRRQAEESANEPKEFAGKIFPFIRDKTQLRQTTYKLQGAALFGSKVIFDCSFGHLMGSMESRSCAEQIQLCFADNRRVPRPLDLNMAEFPDGGTFARDIEKAMQTDQSPYVYMMDRNPAPITEIFPDRKLIYLTPDSKNLLTSFDHDACYVIGALVDRGPDKPHTFSKAMSLNIAHARLPTKEYLSCWYKKSFTLNDVVKCLNLLKEGHDWETIFEKVIPKRFQERTHSGQAVQRRQSKRGDFVYSSIRR